MAKKYAVLGNPIEHSLSPDIHNNFAKQTSIILDYQKILVALDGFDAAVKKFAISGGLGFNITVPFKKQAFAICHKTTENAQLAQAVNTIKIDGNNLIGENTDGDGLVVDLTKNLNYNINDKTILILGAGGASAGILYPLLLQKPKKLMIANRTKKTAQEMAKRFANYGNTCGFGLDKIKNEPVDIIINATAASLTNDNLELPEKLANNALCYDLMYGKKTSFMDWAEKNHAKKISDGLGMLVEQAALSFEFWHNKKPNTDHC